MNIPEKIQNIEVYYDGRCAVCCTFHEWVNRQDRLFPVRFVAYQSEQAEILFPGVTLMDPGRDMIVRTDQRDVFRGAEGWVLCLLSCQRYQKCARRLASPQLLPVARKCCHLIAKNRLSLSKILLGKKSQELAQLIHQMPEQKCDRGCAYEAEDHERDTPDGLI